MVKPRQSSYRHRIDHYIAVRLLKVYFHIIIHDGNMNECPKQIMQYINISTDQYAPFIFGFKFYLFYFRKLHFTGYMI